MGRYRFAFLRRGQLLLLAVTRKPVPVAFLVRQLRFVYAQILFILTEGALAPLRRNPGYDLRSLLGGTRAQLKSLLGHASASLSLALNAVPTLPLPNQERASLTRELSSIGADTSAMLYAMVLAGDRLVALAESKRPEHRLRTADLILILNMVRSTQSLRRSETWLPLCLPWFNRGGFLHA